jgi:hypothetical protein
MAIWLAATGQRDADRNPKDAEQSQGRASSVPSQGDGNECDGNGDLGDRKQQTQRLREGGTQTEIVESLARSLAVGEFRDAREKKHGGQEKPGDQQSAFHDSRSSSTCASGANVPFLSKYTPGRVPRRVRPAILNLDA